MYKNIYIYMYVYTRLIILIPPTVGNLGPSILYESCLSAWLYSDRFLEQNSEGKAHLRTKTTLVGG